VQVHTYIFLRVSDAEIVYNVMFFCVHVYTGVKCALKGVRDLCAITGRNDFFCNNNQMPDTVYDKPRGFTIAEALDVFTGESVWRQHRLE
jgi:hypothetical protein